MSKHRRLAVLAVILLGASLAIVAMARRESTPEAPAAATAPPLAQAPAATPALEAAEQKRFEDAWAAQPVIDLGIPKGTAKVLIVKFNDWLCGGCKQWQEAYQPILDKYQKEAPGAVKLVMKDWPWNDKCNFTMPQALGGHESSCEAAIAIRLARDRGKEPEMEAWLWSEQQKLVNMRMQSRTAAADAIKAKATSLLVLKPGDFEREFAVRLAAVRQDVADGNALKVQVTPTYFVNGVRTTTLIDPQTRQGGENLPVVYMDAAIRFELKKAK
jgi:protein-disulfide isomerase